MKLFPCDTCSRTLQRLVCVVAFLLPVVAFSQGSTDTLRGRVLTEAGTPLAGARVVVTADGLQQTQETRTSLDGRYHLFFPHSETSYSIAIAAIGMMPQRLNVAQGIAVLADVVLHALPPILDTVVVARHKRRRPLGNRSYAYRKPGADEQFVSQETRGLSPADAGNLAALAGRQPGLALTPNGLSAFGASPTQNGTTFNGLGFNGTAIPLGAPVQVTVATSTFDPSRGGFSGAQTSVTLPSGGSFTHRQLTATLDAPGLQFPDASTRQLGQTFTNGQLSWTGSGPIVPDRAFYNITVQGGRATNAAPILGSESVAALQRLGITADSLSRTLQLLRTAGIPLVPPAPPHAVTTTSVSTLSQLDVALDADRSFRLTASGDLSQTDAALFAPSAVLAHSGTSSTVNGTLQAAYNATIDSMVRTEWQTALSLQDVHTRPYLALPEGNVLVTSQFPDSTMGSATVAFGGNANAPTKNRTWSWETRNETWWNSQDNRHMMTAMADAQLQGLFTAEQSNRFGTYTYNSLADLAQNLPAAFTRTIGEAPTSARVWNIAASFGDLWTPNSLFQAEYGLRVDGDRVASALPENPLVDSLFRVRTDHAPNLAQLSPRVGFTWIIANPKRHHTEFDESSHGILRGGIGEFQSVVTPGTIAGIITSAQIPQQLQCLGPAIPAPNWIQFANDPSTIPTACLTGQAAGGFASTGPTVQLLGPGYTPPRSWRGNLSWKSTVHGINTSVMGVYSLGLTPGLEDLNFRGVPQFSLLREGDRPVFVAPTEIVSTTGAVATTSARVSPDLSSVLSAQGTFRSITKQVTLNLSPNNAVFGLFPELSYTVSNRRTQSNGFAGSTAGDPRTVTWSRTPQQQQITLRVDGHVHGITLSAYEYLLSGVRYTPLVGGDINGDGLTNDRAFIPNPAQTADPTVAAAMQTLLQTTSGATRTCLARQLGQLAGANSCVGPWIQNLSLSAQLNGRTLHLTNRFHLQLYAANPLGGLDQLLHGAHLHGWGTTSYPDPILLEPTGFAPSTQQFTYTVNPAFGNTAVNHTLNRTPFQITLGGSFDVGRPVVDQEVARLLARGRRGDPRPRVTADEIRQQMVGSLRFVSQLMLGEKNTILLTRQQIQQIDTVQQLFNVRTDSIWIPEAKHLAELGDHYNPSVEGARFQATRQAVLHDLLPDFAHRLRELLTSTQWALLPSFIRQVFTDPDSFLRDDN